MTGQSPDPLLGLPLMAYGSFSESWGPNLNNAMITLIAQATVGLTTISSAGGTYTLSATNYVSNEARKRVIKIVGTQTSNLTMVIPPRQAWYWAVNSGTSGGYTATIGVTGGLQVDLPYGRATPVFTDGTDTWSMLPRLDQMPVPTAYLDMNGYTVSNLPSPVLNTHAATKAYVDALVSNPDLDNVGAPTTAYSFNGQRLINLGAAVNPNDAVSLQVLNGAIAAASISGATTTAAAGTFLAGPSSAAATGTPAFRRIVESDIPVDAVGSIIAGQVFGGV